MYEKKTERDITEQTDGSHRINAEQSTNRSKHENNIYQNYTLRINKNEKKVSVNRLAS